MKKLLLLTLTLSLLLIISGCSAAGLNSCSRSFTNGGLAVVPGAQYLIIYPGVPALILDRFGKADGTVSFPSHGQPCGSITVTDVRKSNLSLTANPSSVYLPSPPASGTVTGQEFDTTYAMPRVDYFDGNGYLVGSAYATSVTGGGTSLQANMPDLTNAYSGTYQVRVTNKRADGYYSHIVGTATMSGWGRDRPDSDGDGWYDDEDCSPYDPYYTNNCNTECGGYGTTPRYICDDMVY